MDTASFLNHLYNGTFDKATFDSYRETVLSPEANDIIKAFEALSRKYPPKELEALGTLPAEILNELKAIRFFGLSIPKSYGGVGLSLREYLRVLETVAARNIVLGFTATAHLSIGVKGVVLFGTEEQKKRYLPAAASGEMIFSYALTEPGTGSDAANIETRAILSKDGAHYLLNGTKTYITNANLAGGMTVFAQLDPAKPGHMGAFIVETAREGVTIGREMPKMGLKASSTAMVKFDNVRVPRENLLGAPGDGFKIAMTILNYGRMALGAASVGIMEQSLHDMTRRAETRKQFGGPIKQNELIQEKLVKAEVDSFIASAATNFTAGQLERAPLLSVAVESSHCKLFGTTRAWDTLYNAMQVSGGAGYLATHPYEQRMRDFRVTTIFEGTTEIHSMYPALSLLRALGKKLRKNNTGTAGRLVFLARGMLSAVFMRHSWDTRFQGKELKHLLHAGLLFYGKDIARKQFFLRKISMLSLYLYGAISVLASMRARLSARKDISRDRALSAVFLEEALRYKKQNSFSRLRKRERLTKRIMAGKRQ
jgi:acyl-CoA dehydrogenase family member 9